MDPTQDAMAEEIIRLRAELANERILVARMTCAFKRIVHLACVTPGDHMALLMSCGEIARQQLSRPSSPPSS